MGRQLAVTLARHQTCLCCDPVVGRGDGLCAALEMLHSLEADLSARDAIIERESAEGIDPAGVHRGARWAIYRLWIAMKYGHLGAGIRVMLPDCVVGAIRSRWSEPLCNCATIPELAACKTHGYTGYRAAASRNAQ